MNMNHGTSQAIRNNTKLSKFSISDILYSNNNSSTSEDQSDSSGYFESANSSNESNSNGVSLIKKIILIFFYRKFFIRLGPGEYFLLMFYYLWISTFKQYKPYQHINLIK